MILAVATLTAAAAYAAPAQSTKPEAPRPLAKLADDLHTVTARAHLSDEQKDRLQTDAAVLQSARNAKDHGFPVDRQKVTGAVRDIRSIADSGAFSAADKQILSTDIQALRAQR